MINYDPAVKSGFRDFKDFVNRDHGGSSVDAWAETLEQRVPSAADAIRKAGLTPHDCLLVLIIIAEEAFRPHEAKNQPRELSTENALFVRTHGQEIVEVMKPFDRAFDSAELGEPR